MCGDTSHRQGEPESQSGPTVFISTDELMFFTLIWGLLHHPSAFKPTHTEANDGLT